MSDAAPLDSERLTALLTDAAKFYATRFADMGAVGDIAVGLLERERELRSLAARLPSLLTAEQLCIKYAAEARDAAREAESLRGSLLRADAERNELAKRQDFWVRSVQDLESSPASASLRDNDALLREAVNLAAKNDSLRARITLLEQQLSGLSEKVRALPGSLSYDAWAKVICRDDVVSRSAVLDLFAPPNP